MQLKSIIHGPSHILSPKKQRSLEFVRPSTPDYHDYSPVARIFDLIAVSQYYRAATRGRDAESYKRCWCDKRNLWARETSQVSKVTNHLHTEMFNKSEALISHESHAVGVEPLCDGAVIRSSEFRSRLLHTYWMLQSQGRLLSARRGNALLSGHDLRNATTMMLSRPAHENRGLLHSNSRNVIVGLNHLLQSWYIPWQAYYVAPSDI